MPSIYDDIFQLQLELQALKTGLLNAITITNLTGYLPLTGGTITGPLYLQATPISPTQAATKYYVDYSLTTASIDILEDVISNINTTSYLPTTGGTINGDLTIDGNLYFNGTSAIIDATTMSLGDQIIYLNTNNTESLHYAGISITRPGEPNVSLIWNDASDVWQVTDANGNYDNLVTQTELITQVAGTSFLYTTNTANENFIITHNLNSMYPSVTCYDTNTNYVVLPNSIQTLGPNQIEVTFDIPVIPAIKITT